MMEDKKMGKGNGSTRSGKDSGSRTTSLSILPFKGDKQSVQNQIVDDFWKRCVHQTKTLHMGRGYKNVVVDNYSYTLGGYNVSIRTSSRSDVGSLVIKDSSNNIIVNRVNTGITTVALPKELYRLVYTDDKRPHISKDAKI